MPPDPGRRGRLLVLMALAGVSCSGGTAPGGAAVDGADVAVHAGAGAPTEDEVIPADGTEPSSADLALARALDRRLCRKRGCCLSAIEDAGADRKGRTLLVVTLDMMGGGCLVPQPRKPETFGAGVLNREPSPFDADKTPDRASAGEEEEDKKDDGEEHEQDSEQDSDESASQEGGRDDCRPYQYRLAVIDKGKVRSHQLLIETCNDGYGFAGVGEDEISVDLETQTFTHQQSGGSNWRGDHTTTIGLDPLRIVSRGESSFWTMDESGTQKSSDWDLDRFVGLSTRSVPDCAGRRKQAEAARGRDPNLGSDEEAASKTLSYLPIPRLSLPAAFVAEGWRRTALGDCAAIVDGDKRGFTVHGPKGNARDATLRALISSDGVLFAEVADDRWTTKGPSWVKEDHLELWLDSEPAAAGGDSCDDSAPPPSSSARQWGIRISDGTVFPAVGAPAPLRDVEVVRAGGVARLKIPLHEPPAAGWKTITVVYSDSDDGLHQKRLIATSDIDRTDDRSLGEAIDVDPAEATCAVKRNALHIVRVPLHPNRDQAIAN